MRFSFLRSKHLSARLPQRLAAGFSIIMALALVVTACSGGDDTPPAGADGTRPTATQSPRATVESVAYVPPHNRPGPAAERLLFRAFNVDRAPLDFQAGSMDMYLFSLKTDAARDLRGKEGVRLDQAPATTISLVLNPAPDPRGFNPFAIKEIRQAVQFLVDRSFITGDIYKGAAQSMLTHVAPSDFDFLTVFEIVRESDYRFDPEQARSIIDREMVAAGANKDSDGKWQFESQPVTLKFIIRTEDERRALGDLIAFQLEDAGFTVRRVLQQFAPAVTAVYSSNPQDFAWHLYTEGWGRGGTQRFDFASINQFIAPWQGNMPGWRESGFWQYENEELDDIGQRIFTGDFSGVDERNELYRRMTQIGLDESIRIWIAVVQNSFPLRDDIRGITTDLVAGPKTARSLREAYIPGQDDLTLGNLWVWTARSVWNPVGGFGDVYSNDIWRNLFDPPVANNPFTGIPEPFRAGFTVETAGPNGKLAIPDDTVQWDPETDRWVAAEATQATSKVTFDFSKYFSANWHHGQRISMADVVYSIAQGYEIAFDDDKTFIETAIGVTSRPFLNTFRGYRVLDGNRLEVYVDFWHFEESQIGAYATPTGLTTPWEILAAMDELVFEQRRAAYSNTSAGRFNVPWLSLAQGRDARLVVRALREFAEDSTIPDGYFIINNRALVSPEEAQNRFQAAIDWFDRYELLVISNGPFFLTRYDPPAQFAELQAFRDESYPFKPGDFYLGPAPRVDINRVQAGDIQRGRAYEVTVEVDGPGVVGLQYVLFDPANGKVIESGMAEDQGNGVLLVRISEETTQGLDSSLYQLFLAAFSDELASLTERQVDIEVVG